MTPTRPWKSALHLHVAQLELRSPDGLRVLCRDLAFDVHAGERWAVIGPNGAGKSTLLATLAGLQSPGRGRIALMGRALGEWHGDALAQWRAWCPQFWSDPFPARVDETVRLARPHAAFDAQQARALEALLAECDLSALRTRDVRRLSGGERQRVAIATALWQDSPLMLLDEPTSHLDLAHQQLATQVLAAHARRGGAAMASLHDLNLAWGWATHAVVLSGDEWAHAGTRDEVMTPQALTRAFGVPISRVEVCGEQRFWVAAATRAQALSVAGTAP